MKKYIYLLALITSFATAQTERVLIVGDSWADQQFTDGIHDQVFSNNGHADIIVANSSTVAISGTTAADWIAPSQLQVIADAISANPDVDIVQLTIGGNDFLNAWSITMTQAQEDALKQQIVTDLNTIVNHILAQRPNIEVILSFYDYPNFVDTISGLGGTTCNNLYNDLGQPTVTELNTVGGVFETAYSQIASEHGRVYHVSHFGLMQSFYGFPAQNINPGDILPPGDLSLPSPIEAMRLHAFSIRDCFHLTPQGYTYLIQDVYDGYFAAKFDSIYRNSME